MADISVIIPVYQAELYLRQCLDSVLGQTYADLEILLVDDGSTDGSLAICQEYAERDSRVRCFHQENAGQAAARNLALKDAKGDWLCFVDSDDSIHPQMVQLLYEAARKSGAAISQCRMLEAVERPGDFDRPRCGDFQVYDMNEATLTAMLDRGEYPAWVSCAKLIKRELVEGYPFTPGRVYEDNEAVCRWVCQAGRLADLKEALYFYRGNPNSTTKAVFSKKRLDYLWALESILRYYGELGWPVLQRRFCDLYAETAADYYRNCLEQQWQMEAKGICEQANKIFRQDRIPLTKRQFEILLDAFHPKWMPTYWILEAIARRLGFVKRGE